MSLSRFPHLGAGRKEYFPLFRLYRRKKGMISSISKKFVRYNSFSFKHEACLRIANPIPSIH